MRSSRTGLLLALLLVLVAVTAPAMSGAGAAPHSPTQGATVGTASSVYDELHDRPRGPVTTGFAPTTAQPDTWWVVWPPANPGNTQQTRSSVAPLDSTVTPAAAVTPWSSRAPPRA
ncbi:hypothetical protein [Actinophytocola sp. NPDC049390]|uniref:hypothetical protein n=1 Tax=Actinophytocola sp. NPDC049390 TaxID=3363894 RepID=UPI003791340F